jgi:hypothetical protein
MTTPKLKKESMHGAVFAKGGGSAKMHKAQAAALAKAGQTGKAQSPAPGATRASGGPVLPRGAAALPAKAGQTGTRKGR